MSKKPTVTSIVVGAVIIQNQKVLILQRSSNESVLPDIWELPSGKREAFETLETAVIREVKEETTLQVKVHQPLNTFIYQVDKENELRDTIQVNFIALAKPEFEIKLTKDHQKFAWVNLSKIGDYEISKPVKNAIELAFKQISNTKATNQKPETTTLTQSSSNLKLTIYCDGASRGNPGPASSAFVVVNEVGKTIHQLGKYLGSQTNNVAEYQAVILALDWLNSANQQSNSQTIEKCIINLDSELLYKQITGEYKVKAVHLKPLHQQIIDLKQQIQSRGVNLQFQHQLRAHNKLPDQLCNQILDHQTSS